MRRNNFDKRPQNVPDGSLVVSAEINAQFSARDPVSASHLNLSNDLRFLIDL